MSRSDSSSSQRGKLLLIPVLLLVLGYVIWDNNPMNGAATGELSLKDPPPPPAVPSGNEKSATSPSWPEVPLETILAHNPFEELAPSHDPAKQVPAAPIETNPAPKPTPPKPPQLKVQAILKSPEGAGALVGGKLIHEGDVLDGGWRVVRIDSNGVFVKPSADRADKEK